MIAIGFCLIAGSIWIWVMVVVYFIACYIPVIRFEEKILRDKFPNHFPRYAKEIPAFFPGFRIFPHASTKFSWKQVWKNKEYNAVLGIIAAFAYLLLLRK